MVSESLQTHGHIRLPVLGQYGCPECGSINLNYYNEETVCRDCGLVIQDYIIDQGPEWRTFDREQEERRPRTGAPTTVTIHDKGLSTTIDYRDMDVYGKKFNPEQKAQIYRLRKWQKRIRVSDAIERNLAYASSEISNICSKLSLPKSVQETACNIYRRAVKERLTRGRSIDSIAAASVKLACRLCKVPRRLTKIAGASKSDKKTISSSYRLLGFEFNYKLPSESPIDYSEIFKGIDANVSNLIEKTIIAAKEARISGGKDPVSIAAAASYISYRLFGKNVTQKEIADTGGITEVTLRNRYKDLFVGKKENGKKVHEGLLFTYVL